MTNYFDKNGNYINCENLSLAEIYHRAFALGAESTPVEDKRPKGEWARHDEWVGGVYVGGFYHVNCLCEDGYYSKWETNYCPNCGARMIKEGENGTDM